MTDFKIDLLKDADGGDPYEEYIEVEGSATTYEVPVSGLNPDEMDTAEVQEHHGTIDIQRVVSEQGPGKMPEIVGLAWDPTDWMTVVVMKQDSDAVSGWRLIEHASRTTSAKQEVLWERNGWVEDFILACEREGIDETPIIDWFMTEVGYVDKSEWKEIRGVSRQAVNENCIKATDREQ
jgi:hypothetical protein